VDATRALRKEHRSLTSRVRAADDDGFFAGAELRLHESGRVVDADSLEACERRQRRLAILRARCDDYGVRLDTVALLVQLH